MRILASLVVLLAAAEASAQVCVSCWNETCRDLASYTPKCAPATTPPTTTPPPALPPPRLSVETIPVGLSITIDGKAVGTAPVSNLQLTAGSHTLRGESRCHDVEETITLRDGDTRSIRLAGKPRTATIHVVAQNGGRLDANIYVDGNQVSATAAPATVSVCSRQVIARTPEGKAWSTTLSLSPGERRVLVTNLASNGGTFPTPPTSSPPPTTTPPTTTPPTTTPPATTGGVIDPKELERLLVTCQGGTAASCRSLGLAFRDGSGVVADPQKAASFFEQGCELNDGESCFELGKMYGKGEGVAKDEARANAIYERACTLGDRRACDAVRRAGRGNGTITPAGPSTLETYWVVGGALNTTTTTTTQNAAGQSQTSGNASYGAYAGIAADSGNDGITAFATLGWDQVGARAEGDNRPTATVQEIVLSPLNIYAGNGIWRLGGGFDLSVGFNQSGNPAADATGFGAGASLGGGIATSFGPVLVVGLLRFRAVTGDRDNGVYIDLMLGLD